MKHTILIIVIIVLLGFGAFWLLGQNQDATTTNPPTSEQNDVAANEPLDLVGTTWVWDRTQYNNDTERVPNDPEAFTVTFAADRTVTATTDCNNASGSYEENEGQLAFGPMAMTRMFCPDSQEQVFIDDLTRAQSYLFSETGQLVLELPVDTGGMFFSAQVPRLNTDDADPATDSELVATAGVVRAVDTSAVAADGPITIVLDTGSDEVVITVPSMGLPLCPAAASIADPFTIEAGDRVSVAGIGGPDGSITPCSDSAHYLRIEA